MSLERLQRLLGDPHLSKLRARLRSRYERGFESGVVTLTSLSEIERTALAGLLGLPLRSGASMRIEIEAVDAGLRNAGLADSLREALVLLDGSITDKVAERAATSAQWHKVRSACEPPMAAMLSNAQGLGLLKRLSNSDPQIGAELCQAAQCVLRCLPATGMARSRLAAEALGDAHALDSGHPVATLVQAVLRSQRCDCLAEDEQLDESVRSIWADAGVLVNELARPALFLNLPVAGSIVASGQPGYLSLRELLRTSPALDVSGRTVFVCENPNLVAIAAERSACIARRWSAPTACRLRRSALCWRNSQQRGRNCATTAISTGRVCVSAIG